MPVDTVFIFITPGKIPGEILPPSTRLLNKNTLLVSIEATAKAEVNGVPVEEHVIESSSDPNVSGSSRITVQLNQKVQRVTTQAHTISWDDTSSFTLSLGDFHDNFTVPVGHGTATVQVKNGDNVFERSTGSISFLSVVARGVFFIRWRC